MSTSLKTGVVDSNLKVFGVKNLWIAGSSVFSTSGHANPTLSIVQFSLRLGNHLSSLKT
jgi:choline dehydrogenase-like flavoprotein